jgi:hypothetical protein
VDENNDTSDTVQLLIINPGITQSFKVLEELASLKSLHGTKTMEDLFLGETFFSFEARNRNVCK